MIITKTNGSVSSVLNDTFRPLPEQVRRSLGLLDNDDHFAWLVFSAPIDDQTWRAGPQAVIDEYGDSYLQAGGTAEKMSVELRRREDDGEYRFSIVGRDHDLTEPLTETIDVQAAHEPRHPAELFTADQAAPVFMHYVEHQTVPDGYTLRLVADM
ncbi:hypothetical protein ITJ50_14910 [Curtobacterium sp. VKM Ac-2889]|uniref:hypothetical protein n=1 Tax=unclassified Curtobacterium TaxID=257496 RepID=UPI001889FC21|nr:MULTISPECIES: hypothetical protein [unclassified Curtobacterium]MBF4596626.1 hypothetical protein [Curtobacterium sp. VKM Ac-1796]MBF4612512.1 hypothetical protein [Curtobacterium sp. VKM Ac-2889]